MSEEIIRALNENTAAVREMAVTQGVLVERVNNVIQKVDDHLDSDKEIHREHGRSIDGLKEWRTALKTKIGTYAAVAAAVFTVIGAFAKEAFAVVFSAFTNGH